MTFFLLQINHETRNNVVPSKQPVLASTQRKLVTCIVAKTVHCFAYFFEAFLWKPALVFQVQISLELLFSFEGASLFEYIKMNEYGLSWCYCESSTQEVESILSFCLVKSLDEAYVSMVCHPFIMKYWKVLSNQCTHTYFSHCYVSKACDNICSFFCFPIFSLQSFW